MNKDNKCILLGCNKDVQHGKTLYCSHEHYYINENRYSGETMQEYKIRHNNYLERMKAKRALKKNNEN